MRIALISDIHGNLAALEAVAGDLRHRGVDQVVNLGDSVSGPLLPLETAQYIMAQGWLSLAGNHERQILNHGPERRSASDEYAHSQLTAKEFVWLQSLAPSISLTAEVFLCHGTPSSDTAYFLETVEVGGVRAASPEEIELRLGRQRAPLVACGHTHIARTVRTRQGQLVVNPGSVGLPAYDDTHPFPHVVETGSPDARYAIVEKSRHGWDVLQLSVSYDHQSMAELARQRGRVDWEHALRTGYMP
ncbi:metallophosphoesterase family protein [Comamonas terrigena]|uniref:metallophosphoesterase family protein n=1 Tax=Comamonas terrigena TaxID=32013 RepID=UPI00244A29CC|nr:metallophosphoesterase family protein [Comamonas terrigena]MDH1701042.1 metallophosphatase family protein [Comamonas terrigena]